MISAMCQVIQIEEVRAWKAIQWTNPAKKREEIKREGRSEREERRRRNGERKLERKEDRQFRPLIYRCFDCRSSLG